MISNSNGVLMQLILTLDILSTDITIQIPVLEGDAEFRERLLRVSNGKLLRLWSREQDLKARFGSRETLIDKLVESRLGRTDADYRQKLAGLSTGRLLSMETS
jgi:hypothetical protein